MRRGLGAVAGVVLSLILVAPAWAAAPELFVRTQTRDTHEETGPWITRCARSPPTAGTSAPSTMRRRKRVGYYFLNAGTDPNPLYLRAARFHRVCAAAQFPPC